MTQIHRYAMQIDEYTVFVYRLRRDNILLKEGASPKGTPLVGPYSYRKDKPHSSVGMYHLHVFERQNEVFAINWDGTAHDQSHGRHIPNRVNDALKKKFPSLVLPKNQIIAECFPVTPGKALASGIQIGLTLEELAILQRFADAPADSPETTWIDPPSRVSFFKTDRIPSFGTYFLLTSTERQSDCVTYEFHLWEDAQNKVDFETQMVSDEPTTGVGLSLAEGEEQVLRNAEGRLHCVLSEMQAARREVIEIPATLFHPLDIPGLRSRWIQGRFTEALAHVRNRTQHRHLLSLLDELYALGRITG